MEIPTARDLLKRAGELLEQPLPHPWAAPGCPCGPHCVRCALSRASNELDPTNDEDSIRMIVFTGRMPSDAPLERALTYVRRAIGGDVKILERDEALIMVDICITLCELDDAAVA